MVVTPFEYLTEHKQGGWDYKHTGGLLVGCCPIPGHSERTPSFKIFPDGHWHCFGCHKGTWDGGKFGTVTLINHVEFGMNDTPYGWWQAGSRYRQITGEPEPENHTEENEKKKDDPTPKGSLLASEEQQAIIGTLEQWCHQRLWDTDRRFAGRRGQRYYEQERHIPLREYRYTTQVGYAPPHSVQSPEGALLFSHLDEMMRQNVGKDWKPVAHALNILKKYGDTYDFGLRDRVMFFCHDKEDHSVFYQGRKVELPGDRPNNYPKSMNPRGIKKMPFWVPVRNPCVKGTGDIEGPFGALLLPLYGMFTVAWLGGAASYFLMRAFPGPHILLQDHDPLRDGKRTGDEHAKGFIKICEEELHEPWVRIIPGREGDGPDDWVNRDGFGPLRAQLEAHDLLIPTNKTPTGLYLAQVS